MDQLKRKNKTLAEKYIRHYIAARKTEARRSHDGAISTAYFFFRPMLWALIRGGISIDEQDTSGNTLLHHAAAIGDLRTVSRAVRFGAGINQRNNYGETAFSFACVYGHLNVSQFLARHGARTKLQFKNGDYLSENELVPSHINQWLKRSRPKRADKKQR